MNSTPAQSDSTIFQLLVNHGGSSKSVDIYEARPKGPPRGAIVVVQEIFGVTDHIRSVAERYAALGFVAWAPAFFDPVEKHCVLPYGQASIDRGLAIVGQLGWDWPIEIVRACSKHWSLNGHGQPLALVGYCWGGSVAWLASTRLQPSELRASIGYYGSKAYDFREETPRLPVMLHFGKTDHGIPLEKVEALKQAHPNVPIELYDAGHGFNRDGGSSYNAEAAELALDKTMAFLVRNGF